ncbi:glycoside hydrolase family 30 protein [Cellvibrio sp. NN19]|uniref:glycoside hydrolase family 30 protein n=1 Tax=Cellvibrio chitinivorans TaxID=3102792 RepID=UPI002B40DAAB|nr:glycoside hydrolase family 30 protein [Cellvibrio sp. NN19]
MNKHVKKLVIALALASPALGAYAADSSNKTLSVYTTAKDTNQKLSLGEKLSFKAAQQNPETDVAIYVNPNNTYQTFLGFGGAVTDASAETYAKLSSKKQKEFIKAYYDKKDGIGYSLLRTTIHSSDFASGSHTYIDEGDKELKTFNIKHDQKYRIPLIKQVIKAAGGKITTYASPWSAPAFMKDTNNMLQGGKLLPEYNHAWALYYTKFIKAYEKEGIPIWGITIQNEPMAKQTWESMIYTADEERDFLKNHLGPVMQQEGLGDKKIIVWDHNRDLITHRVNTIMADPEAAKYVWGVGFHWYETWAGGKPMYGNVAEVHNAYPNLNLLVTEATVEKFDAARFHYWPNAERYGDSIINDFNSGAVAWTDWNILLDNKGGPNHVGNFCFAPIHENNGELIYTPTYYYIGHFSKFIRPDAKRVSAVPSRSVLQTTSWLNADNSLITVVMNSGDSAVDYRLYIGDKETRVSIPAHAMQTLVY